MWSDLAISTSALKPRFPKAYWTFLVVFALGVGLLFPFLIFPLRDTLRARHWLAVPCTITASNVERVPGDSDGDTYRANISYTYFVKSQSYNSDRYSFQPDVSINLYSWKQSLVDRLPVGMQTTCFVDPADPSMAVLDRDVNGDFCMALIPIAMMAFGLGVPIGVKRSIQVQFHEQSRGLGTLALVNETSGKSRLTSVAALPAADKPRVLAEESSRAGRFVHAIVKTTLAIAVAFAFLASYLATAASQVWFIPVVFTVCVVVAYLVIRELLRLFSPHAILTLDHQALRLGHIARLEYCFQGNYQRITRLRIVLEGQEQVKYKPKNDADEALDKGVFARIVLLETNRPQEMARGYLDFGLDVDAVPTFESAHNKIRWTVKVLGETPMGARLDDEYILPVLPAFVEACA